jgi:glycosyltransferase involved in cell wall biosynthesis
MNTLVLSTFDINGGAARAAYRLHLGLQSAGLNSKMMVQYKVSNDKTVLEPSSKLGKWVNRLRPTLDGLPLQLYPRRNCNIFSCQWLPDFIESKLKRLCLDVINLHWNCAGYLSIESLAKFKIPLVWTIHDMWAFTGGCHYSQNCDRYTSSCGSCFQLHSDNARDLSHWIWQRKAKAWRELDLTIIAPSAWLAKCARSSSLFRDLRVEVIPNSLDTQKYKPVERGVARELLNLPQDKQLILFGAVESTSETRKGFHLLQPSLQKLSQSGWQDTVELVVFGSSQPENPVELGFKSHYLGNFSDDLSLALIYAAADVFVAPSIQDNLPNTIMEAIACGTPCVAFNIGGMSDLIEHQENGYLAQNLEVESLAQGIAWVLKDSDRYQRLRHSARKKAEQEFSLETQARRYIELFANVIDENHRNRIKLTFKHN